MWRLTPTNNLTKERIETARLTQKDEPNCRAEQFETAIRFKTKHNANLGANLMAQQSSKDIKDEAVPYAQAYRCMGENLDGTSLQSQGQAAKATQDEKGGALSQAKKK